MAEIKKCKRCGFILGTSPNLKDIDGICTACINRDKKDTIDFVSRQQWLTQYIAENKTSEQYDCLVAVSGGKNSTVIVKKHFENHGIKKALLRNATEEFTRTRTGIHNLDNIVNSFNCDLITFRVNPKELAEHMRKDLTESLNPLKWLEQQIYLAPLSLAKIIKSSWFFMEKTRSLNMVLLKRWISSILRQPMNSRSFIWVRSIPITPRNG